jgi:general stress protein YciG
LAGKYIYLLNGYKEEKIMTSNEDNSNSNNQGFASMDEDKQKEIASKGGKAAHEKGAAHEFDSEEAREAGQKGGKSSPGVGRSSLLALNSPLAKCWWAICYLL